MNTEEIADALEDELAALGTVERAEKDRAYLKSALVHHGTGVPAVRRVVRAFVSSHDRLDHDEVVALAGSLWREPVHERRLAAVELLDEHRDLLEPSDAALLERLLRECRTWALVDSLAAGVVGTLAERDPEQLDPVLRRWAADEDHWIRRAALLAHLVPLREGRGDWDRFCDLADGMLEDRELLIRKAIGWVLRDTAKKRPEMVADWLAPRVDRAAWLTVREAVRRMPERQRDRVLAARAVPGEPT